MAEENIQQQNNQPEGQPQQVIIVQQKATPGFACGIIGLICSILSIFVLTIIFAPLGLLFGLIATAKKNYLWGILSILISLAAAAMSPTVWFLLAGLLHLSL